MSDFSPIVAIVGCGITGRAAAETLSKRGIRLAMHDIRSAVAKQAAAEVGGINIHGLDEIRAADVVLVCSPDSHAELARNLLSEETPVVSVGDFLDDVDELLTFDQQAQTMGVPLVVGAGMSPGLTGLLARALAAHVPHVEEVHVAVHGTGGPACATRHHKSLGRTSIAWRDGEWIERVGGGGRELCWFPDPIGAYDCYRADLADPRLLQRCFPQAGRVSARVSATRRDRLTARLPMLTPPHTGGSVGAVRVEVRGAADDGARLTVINGAAGRAGQIAGTVGAAAVIQVLAGRLEPGVRLLGEDSQTAAELLDLVQDFGVVIQEFTGLARPSSW